MPAPSLARFRLNSPAGRESFDRRLLAPLVLGSILNPINTTIIAVALAPIGHALGVPASRTALLVTALYVTTAVGQPVVGRLVDRFGPRRLFVAGGLLVGIGGLIGTFAPDLAVLVLARVVLGLGTCAGYPAAMYLIRSEARRTGEDSPQGVLTVLAVSSQTIAVIGPTLGGLLIGIGGWRSTFAVNVPLALLSLLFSRRLPRVTVASTTVAAGDPAKPVLRNGPLLATYLRQFLSGLTSYSVLYGITQWLEDGRGLHAAQAGLLLLPLSASALLVSATTGRRPEIKAKLVVGAVFQLAGVVLLLSTTSPSTAIWILAGLFVVFGIPQGLLNLGNQSAVYDQADPARIGFSAGLLRTAFYGGAIGASAMIGLSFGDDADTAGLHSLARLLLVAAVLMLVLTVADRRLSSVASRSTTSGGEP